MTTPKNVTLPDNPKDAVAFLSTLLAELSANLNSSADLAVEKDDDNTNDFTEPANTLENRENPDCEHDCDTFNLEPEHTGLARAIHAKLASCPATGFYFLCLDPCFDAFDSSIYSVSISHRNQVLKKAFDAGNAFSLTNAPSCALDFYLPRIENTFIPIMDALQKYCIRHEKNNLYEKIYELVYQSKTNLSELFEKEIQTNRSFYELPNFEYYTDIAKLEKVNIGTYNDGLLGSLESLLGFDCEYSCPDINEAISQIENDVREKADYFFQAAYMLYVDYIGNILYLIDQLAKDMPSLLKTDDISLYLLKQCC